MKHELVFSIMIDDKNFKLLEKNKKSLIKSVTPMIATVLDIMSEGRITIEDKDIIVSIDGK